MGLPPLGDVKRRRTATYRVVEAAALLWPRPTRRSARVKQPSSRIRAHVDAILVTECFVDVGDVPTLGVRPVVGPRPGSVACIASDTATPSAAARPASGLLLVAGDVPVVHAQQVRTPRHPVRGQARGQRP
jgi:hypothetical protein